MEIQNLDGLLSPYIKGEIIDKKITRLTAPGENYGSLMLKVDVTAKKDDGKEEVFYAVAKCIPPNKQMQEIFDIPTTFKNEIGWYKKAIPALIQFQKDHGVEHVADYNMNIFGARISVNPKSHNLDDSAVILVENLVERGFKNADRLKGFNLTQSQEILKRLANFHATCIALNLEHPEIFNKKVREFCFNKEKQDIDNLNIFENALSYLEQNPDTGPYVNLVQNILNDTKEIFNNNCSTENPWVTAVHSDFWVNNIMISEDNPPKVIILDLQTCSYESALSDLTFFLGTSLEKSVSEKHFDDLLKLYYEEFIKILKELKVNTAKLAHYSYGSFEKELKREGRRQVKHIMFFIPIITAVNDAVSDTTKEEFCPKDGLISMFNVINENQKEKFNLLVRNWVRHSWLY